MRFLYLTLILLLAALLRFSHADWDEGTFSHPDERFLGFVVEKVRFPKRLSQYFNASVSSLNPANVGYPQYVYGTAPLFLARFLADQFSVEDLTSIVRLGRHLSAFLDTLTVLVTYLLGALLYGPAAGLVAAFIAACAVLSIQHAHFLVVEPMLMLCSLSAIYCAARIARGGAARWWIVGGLFTGLAVATKITALFVLAIFAVAFIGAVRGWMVARRKSPQSNEADLFWLLIPPLAFIVMGAATFRLLQPYAFVSGTFCRLHPLWLENLTDLAMLSKMSSPRFPPSVQWYDRSWWYPFEQLVKWGMGYGAGILALGGVLFCAYEILVRRVWIHSILLIGCLIIMTQQSLAIVKPPRYLLPIYPLLSVIAAYLAVVLASRGRSAGKCIVGAALVLHAAWALAFVRMYEAPFPRVAATHWMVKALMPGEAIALEHWDDPLPAYSATVQYPRYQSFALPVFDPDTAKKRDMLIEGLMRANVILLSSQRSYGAISRWTEAYPHTSRYYEALFRGELGFERVGTFKRYPALFGREICTDRADESFSVYDHPKVSAFKKTKALSRDELAAVLDKKSQPGAPNAFELLACNE